jgi:hypothetical protein
MTNWITEARKAHEGRQDVTLTHDEAAFLAARLRRLFAHHGYTLPDFAKDDASLLRIAGSAIGAVLTNVGVAPTRGDQPMDPQRLRELADPSHAAFEEAMRQTWQMVDPIRPAGQPGSYYRGEHNGVIAALKTMRDNYERARRAAGVGEVGRG